MVLVTGGFHTPEIIELIQAQGQSFVCLRPAMTKVDTSNNYFELLCNPERPTDMERLLASQATPTSAMAVVNLVRQVSRQFAPAMEFIMKAPAKMYRNTISRMQSGELTLKQTGRDFIEVSSTEAGNKIGFWFGKIWRIVRPGQFAQIPRTGFLESERVRIGALALLGIVGIVAIPAALGALGLGTAVVTGITVAAGQIAVGLGVLAVVAGGIWFGAKYWKDIPGFFKQHSNVLKGSIVTGVLLIALLPFPSLEGPVFADAITQFWSQVFGDGNAYAATGTLDAVKEGACVVLSNTPGVENLSVFSKELESIFPVVTSLLLLLSALLTHPVFMAAVNAGNRIKQVMSSFEAKHDGRTKERVEAEQKIQRDTKEREGMYGQKYLVMKTLSDEKRIRIFNDYEVIIELQDLNNFYANLQALGFEKYPKLLSYIVYYQPYEFKGGLFSEVLCEENIYPDDDNFLLITPVLFIVDPKKELNHLEDVIDDVDPKSFLVAFQGQGDPEDKNYVPDWQTLMHESSDPDGKIQMINGIANKPRHRLFPVRKEDQASKEKRARFGSAYFNDLGLHHDGVGHHVLLEVEFFKWIRDSLDNEAWVDNIAEAADVGKEDLVNLQDDLKMAFGKNPGRITVKANLKAGEGIYHYRKKNNFGISKESQEDFENLAFIEEFADKFAIYNLMQLEKIKRLTARGEALLELLRDELSEEELRVFNTLWKALKARDKNYDGIVGDILSYPREFIEDSEIYAVSNITAALQLNPQKMLSRFTSLPAECYKEMKRIIWLYPRFSTNKYRAKSI